MHHHLSYCSDADMRICCLFARCCAYSGDATPSRRNTLQSTTATPTASLLLLMDPQASSERVLMMSTRITCDLQASSAHDNMKNENVPTYSKRFDHRDASKRKLSTHLAGCEKVTCVRAVKLHFCCSAAQIMASKPTSVLCMSFTRRLPSSMQSGC